MLLCEGDAYRRVALHNAPPRFAEFSKNTPVLGRGVALRVDHVMDTGQVSHVLDVATEDPNEPRASVTAPRGGVYRCAASFGFSEEFEAYLDDNPLPINRGNVVGRVVLEGKAVQIVDIQSDREFAFPRISEIGNTRTTECRCCARGCL